MPTEFSSNRFRLLAIFALLVCLAGMFVWAGTLTYDTSMNNYPSNSDVAPDPEAYVGQQVSLRGTVVATDPIVIEIDHPEATQITLKNVDKQVSEGDQISAFGTLTDPETLTVENALVRAPWEAWYMYAVSFLGGLWVLGRLVTQWRPDRDHLAFRPRGDRDG